MIQKILIIGDDVDTHFLLSRALSRREFQVSTMPDRQSALLPVGKTQPDLIVFDSLLPGTEGWEALPRIRNVSSVPIIALTDATDSEVKIASLDRGADYCLLKPFDILEFQARVRALLRRRGISAISS